MKRYFLKLTLFLSIFSVLYLAFFFCVDRGLKQSHYLDFTEWNEIYAGEIDAEIIIQGSSRAWRQVDPKIIDSIVGGSTYNLGMDGYQIPMQIARNKIYQQHNDRPTYIIQILDHFSLTRREDLFYVEQFLPYLDDTILKKELLKYKGLSWADYSIPYFRYIGSQETAVVGFMEYIGLKETKSTRYKGFQSENKTWEPEFDIELAANPNGKRANISHEVFEEFDLFLEDSKKQDVEVILVYAPEYYEFQNYIVNRDTVSWLYQQLAIKYDFQYLDYSHDELCLSKENFYNPTHLNKSGAAIFTERLARSIKSIIENRVSRNYPSN